jgi:prepilin-type N-terminal cleavage/methylation domain-containing protein
LLLPQLNSLEGETLKVNSNGAGTMHLIKPKGFALIEVLVALVMAGLMATTTRNNSDGGRMTEAVTLIQDKLEELRATPPKTILNAYNLNQTVQDPVTNVIRGTTYARSWMVVPDVNNTYRIIVTVSWFDKTLHSVNMVTRFSQ